MTNMNKLVTAGLCAMLAFSASASAGGPHYRYHGHYDGHGGAGLAAGLIIGGIFGYLISEDRHRASGHHYHDYRPHSHSHSQVTYHRTGRPVPATGEFTNTYSTALVSGDPDFLGHDCIMTREYTTTVTIDGDAKQAYGTRCMTSDGGWILGRPKLVPESVADQ